MPRHCLFEISIITFHGHSKRHHCLQNVVIKYYPINSENYSGTTKSLQQLSFLLFTKKKGGEEKQKFKLLSGRTENKYLLDGNQLLLLDTFVYFKVSLEVIITEKSILAIFKWQKNYIRVRKLNCILLSYYLNIFSKIFKKSYNKYILTEITAFKT